ncbi:hypothetical protein AZE42_13257, partial [Rhizopogon vesiculosus]
QSERRTSSRGGYGHERSHKEELVEQWGADPEVDCCYGNPRYKRISFEPTGYFPAKEPTKIKKPLDYFRQRFQRTQSNASVPDITVQSPSETASSPSEHARQARPELLSPEPAYLSLPPTHEEHAQTSGSHLGDLRDTYRSTTPSQPS